MDQSPQRSMFLTSNDFCSTQKSKYGHHDQSMSRNERSILLDNTLHDFTNKSVNYNTNATYNEKPDLAIEKNLQETQVPVKIKSLEREEYISILNLSIKTVKRASPQQNLLLQITDDNNLHFLQVQNFTEQEFLILKSEQQLRIDFQNFPTKLMEFIELCLNSSKDEKICFACVLDTTKAPDVLFQIVENNEFKSLTHLSLKFRSANDEMLKKWMAVGWKAKKVECETMFKKLTDLTENYEVKYSQYESITEQMRNMSEEAHNREEKLVNEYEKKINSLKERFLEKENTNLKTFESEKGSADYRFKDRETSLLAKITALENSVSNLSEIKMELESKDKENRSRIRVLESEYNTTSNECDKLRKNNKDLELLKFNQEKQLTELNARLEGLSSKLVDKNELNHKNDEMLERYLKTIQGNETQITDLRILKDKMETKLRDSFQEINKASEQIGKLQEEFNKKKSTLKTRNSIIKKQENIINQKIEELGGLENNITELQRESNFKDSEVKKFEIDMGDLKKKLEELQQKLTNSNDMITYLNNQLNESNKTHFGTSISQKSTTYAPMMNKPSFNYGQSTASEYKYQSSFNNPASITNNHQARLGEDLYGAKVDGGTTNLDPTGPAGGDRDNLFGGNNNISKSYTNTQNVSNNGFGIGGGREMNIGGKALGGSIIGGSRGGNTGLYTSPYKGERSGLGGGDPYKDFRTPGMGEFNRNSNAGNKFTDTDFRDLSAIKSPNLPFNDAKHDRSEDSMGDDMQPRSYKKANIQKIIFEGHD